MKILILNLALWLSLISTGVYAHQNLSAFLPGKWTLNYTSGDGKMMISDCTDSSCSFSIQSVRDFHICDVNGRLNIKKDYAEYETQKYMYDKKTGKEYSVPVGFVLKITENNNVNIHYTNLDSYDAFCGMRATIEGSWSKN